MDDLELILVVDDLDIIELNEVYRDIYSICYNEKELMTIAYRIIYFYKNNIHDDNYKVLLSLTERVYIKLCIVFKERGNKIDPFSVELNNIMERLIYYYDEFLDYKVNHVKQRINELCQPIKIPFIKKPKKNKKPPYILY